MTNGDIRTGQSINVGLPSHEELTRIENDILAEPRIIESGLSTLINRYTYVRTEDGAYLTPDTVIELGEDDDAQPTTVFAGCTESDYHRKVVFQKDPTTGQTAEWIVFSGFPDVGITDGSGRPLESDTDRKYVRSVLEAMKLSYDRDVTAMADGFNIKQHLLDTLDGRIASKEAELAFLQRQRQQAEQHEGTFDKFKVTIRSGWEREGEQSLDEEIAASSLSEVIHKATARFKEMNHRSDVQAHAFSVGVSVGEGQFWTVPDEVVVPLFRALSYLDREASGQQVHDEVKARIREYEISEADGIECSS
jgi:hypothetical protein